MMTKTNKGFSLVELLVAMAVLAIVMAELAQVIFSSSKLYLYGTYEVDLQTEAQQIIQQIEDMLVDARVDVSANYVASLSSDQVITISTNSLSSNSAIEYKINFVPNPDATKEYGSLTLTVRDSAGTVGPIPMAEFVKSVSLDFAEYETDNMLTLYITMQNDRYSYTTTKDIFLRNMLGTGARKRGNQNDSDKMIDVEVLRFGSYNLTTICSGYMDEYVAEHGAPDSFYFDWDDYTLSHLPSDALNDVNNIYSLGNTSGSLKCGPVLNTHFNLEVGGMGSNVFKVVCYAISGGRKNEVCQVQLGTKVVSTGLGNMYANTANSPQGVAFVYCQVAYSNAVTNAIPVQGIDISAAKDATIDYRVVCTGKTSLVLASNSTTEFNNATKGSPFTVTMKDLYNTQLFTDGSYGRDLFANYNFQTKNANYYVDAAQHTLMVDFQLFVSEGNGSGLINGFYKNGFRAKSNCVFSFEQDGTTADLPIAVYYFVLGNEVDDDLIEEFSVAAQHDQ